MLTKVRDKVLQKTPVCEFLSTRQAAKAMGCSVSNASMMLNAHKANRVTFGCRQVLWYGPDVTRLIEYRKKRKALRV